MPPSKPKPSEIAAEAKKTYIPYIRANYSEKWPSTSYLCFSDAMVAEPKETGGLTCRFAFYERDPVDLALDWAEPGSKTKIPVIMPANDKRPGGDWEAGVMSPEECLCRRSTLFATLTTPAPDNSQTTNYPIPPNAGIYSQEVVVFRDGPEKYEPYQEYKALPIISVPPIRRPKLDSTGKKYSFKAERELMRSQIRTALRIAIWYQHTQLCIGTFGLGSGFRNPVEEVALMWREAILKDPEFVGHFQDVVFAFDPNEGGGGGSSKAGSSKHGHGHSHGSSSKSHSSSSKGSGVTADLEVFRHVFKPSVVLQS